VRIRWLRTALTNLDDEAEHIATANGAAAVRTVTAILEAVSHLSRYPSLGRPGRVDGTRDLVVDGTPSIIPYRVRGDTIEVLRVFHAARRWPEEF
jgi:toxin ParE1/3/4